MSLSKPGAPSSSRLSKFIASNSLDRLSRSDVVHALTHRSFEAENIKHESNERLEFLGDAVLDLIVAEYLFAQRPDWPEGFLSAVRASLVSSSTLAPLGASMGVGECLFLGKGEEATGGREKASLIADAVEALVAVVYLRLGYDSAREFVLGVLSPLLDAALALGSQGLDHKSRLQEVLSVRDLGTPEYKTSGKGPDHAREFGAQVLVNGQVFGQGNGRSKKTAEQEAACEALLTLGEITDAEMEFARRLRGE